MASLRTLLSRHPALARAGHHGLDGLTPTADPLPDLPAPAHALLALCAESGLRRLVHRHKTRLKLTPLLNAHGDCFDCISERWGDFVIESCGGPLYFSERRPDLRRDPYLTVARWCRSDALRLRP